MSVNDILIWDVDDPYPRANVTIILWRKYSIESSPYIISIPEFVEKKADVLRSRYLAWLYELGEVQLCGRRLIDHLQLRANFSYWWMTLIAEKCNYSKSPNISDAIRLIAFTDWADLKHIKRITLRSANEPLAKCMRHWCKRNDIKFDFQKIANCSPDRFPFMRRAYSVLPFVFQGLIWLFYYLVKRFPLRGVGIGEWGKMSGKILFVSYLFNMSPDHIKHGKFKTNYWAHLPEALRNKGEKINFIHIYLEDNLIPTAKKAANLIRDFNKNEKGGQCHVTLDTFLNFVVIFRALLDWLRLVWVGACISRKLRVKIESISDLNLWPLFQKDWKDSIFGRTSIKNVLSLNQFEFALKALPTQKKGVYLQENQGWEFGFIYAWKSFGHSQLIGAPHTTVRFWDLRYFFDYRCYLRKENNDLPIPNYIACNGGVVKDNYIIGNYPAEHLINVEALRYLHLEKGGKGNISYNTKRDHPIRVLVLGDFLHINTRDQINLLVQATELLSISLNITVKPHPNSPVIVTDYPSISLEITMKPILELLRECDVAYASAVTTAAVDAYFCGIPIISLLDSNSLNLSPLRGCDGAVFVSTAHELAAALEREAKLKKPKLYRNDYFTIDKSLCRWIKLLS